MHTNNNHGLRLLSLDGGGIRGLSTLLILQTIMHRIKAEEELPETPLPCEYFDLIGGTSTGGIIALMLGRLRMSVDDTIKCYEDLSEKIFSDKKWVGDGKYKATTLQNVIKDIVREKVGDPEAPLFDDGSRGRVCKTFVCAMNTHDMNAKIPVIFRTYESPKEPSIPCKVWEAVRATSAAPTFFKKIEIGPRAIPFIDGGLGRNNPTAQVLAEAEDVYSTDKVACVISIGTGQAKITTIPDPNFIERNIAPIGVLKAVVAISTDCEGTTQQMERLFKRWPGTYFRFNVEQGLQKVKLGEWKKLGQVADITRHYMRLEEVDRKLGMAVQALRERRGVIIYTSQLDSIATADRGPADIDISPSRLPEPPIYFFGRHEQHTQIIQSLLKAESVIIPGSGGMGKTTLALAALYDNIITAHFQSRIYFVDCSKITTLDALFGQLAVDLHIPKDRRNSDLESTLLQAFRRLDSAILCLNNFETMWDIYETRHDLETTLSRFSGIPALSLLVTLRGTQRPDIRWADSSPYSLPRLSDKDSMDLFKAESRREGGDKYMQSLVEVADGMPLSIKLLARLCVVEEPKATWARWKKKGTFIASHGRGRLMNLHDSIELSLNGPRMQGDHYTHQTLAVLAYLPNGLANPSEIIDNLEAALPDGVDISSSLSKLVETGLAYIDAKRSGRYRLLSPISAYARNQQMLESNWKTNLIDVYVGFAATRRPESISDPLVLPEFVNVHSVLDLNVPHSTIPSSTPYDERYIEAIITVSRWNMFLGIPSTNLIERTLLNSSLLSPELLGQCHRAVGDLYLRQNRLEEAEQSLNRAMELHQQVQDVFGEGDAHKSLGDLYLRQNRLEEAEQSLNHAMELYHQAQNVLGEGNTCKSLGDLYLRQNQFTEAEQSLNRAMVLYQQVHSVLGEGNAHKSLGGLYLRQTRLKEAEKSLNCAIKLYQQVQHVLGESNAYHLLGDLYVCQNRLEEAEQSLNCAMELHPQVQDVLNEGNTRKSLGDLYLLQNRLEEAEQSLNRAMELYQQARHVLGEGNAHKSLGDLYLSQNRLEEAEQSLNYAMESYQQVHSVLSEGNTHKLLGDLYLRQNRLKEAEKSLNCAMELYRQAQNVLGEGNAHYALGDLYLHQNQFENAEQSLNRAMELYQQAQHVFNEGITRKSLGDLYMHQHRFEEAEQSLNCAIELYQQVQDVGSQADALQSLGQLHLCQGRVDELQQTLDRATELYSVQS